MMGETGGRGDGGTGGWEDGKMGRWEDGKMGDGGMERWKDGGMGGWGENSLFLANPMENRIGETLDRKISQIPNNQIAFAKDVENRRRQRLVRLLAIGYPDVLERVAMKLAQ